MLPADEGLDGDDAAVPEVDLGLEVQDQRVLGHGVPQLGHQGEASRALLVGVG